MRTPCIVCHRLIPVGTGGRCWGCASASRKARSKAKWAKLSKAVRAAGVCEACGRPFRPADLEADHIIPIRDRPDLAHDAANVQALCKPCHLRKPASAR
jgi:5-methylcytosine-specific restriction endonuclease McrA